MEGRSDFERRLRLENEAVEAQEMSTKEQLPVKVGIGVLDKPMTLEQALRWGKRNMPGDLKAAGFQATVFRSDPEIHGSHYFRVNYGK